LKKLSIKEILEKLNQIAPFELQERWDNSGLLIGSQDREVDTITLSLDIDDGVIENSPDGSLLITHHPLIFSGLKELNFQKYPSNLIEKIIRKNIQLISLHTNFDKTILNRYVLEKILGWEVDEKIDDFILIAKVEKSGDEVFQYVKERFHLPYLKFTTKPKFIERVALTTGSGASLKSNLTGKVDLFLTGDIKYHDAFEAKSEGLALLDIGHFESEKFFGDAISPFLEDLNLNIIKLQSNNPFTYE